MKFFIKLQSITYLLLTTFTIILITGCRTIYQFTSSEEISLDQLKLSSNDVSGWSDQPMDKNKYIGDELFTLIDGGAPKYLQKGCLETFVQDMGSKGGKTLKAQIMDFGSPENALTMYNESMSYVSSPMQTSYPGFSVINQGNSTAYAAFKQFYFEISVSGFSDRAQANQILDLVLRIYYDKVF